MLIHLGKGCCIFFDLIVQQFLKLTGALMDCKRGLALCLQSLIRVRLFLRLGLQLGLKLGPDRLDSKL